MNYSPDTIATSVAVVLLACVTANMAVRRILQLMGHHSEYKSNGNSFIRALCALLWLLCVIVTLSLILWMRSDPVIVQFLTASKLNPLISLLVIWAIFILSGIFEFFVDLETRVHPVQPRWNAHADELEHPL